MRLAALDLPAEDVTLVWTVPADRRAIVSLNLVNRTAARCTVRVAVTDGEAPAAADWIEYDTPIVAAGQPGGSVLLRSGLVLGAGQQLHVRASAAGVGAVVYGVVEEVA